MGICHGFVLRGTQIGKKSSHLVKGSSSNSLVVPRKSILLKRKVLLYSAIPIFLSIILNRLDFLFKD